MANSKELTAMLALRDAFDKKFGQDIVIMDLQGVTPLADYFVLVTGTSIPQLSALSDIAEEILYSHGFKIKHREGVNSANWTLLDFGDVVVHIFDKESREYYNLERTWADALIVPAAQG